MEEHIMYALNIIETEIDYLKYSLEYGNHSYENIEVINLDILRLKQQL